MAIVQVATAPSRAQYDQVAPHVDLHGSRPDGLILHVTYDLPDGRVQVLDVYESDEALDAFGEERVFPAFAAVGILEAQLAGPRPERYAAQDLVR